MIKRWVWVMALAALLWAAARPAASQTVYQPHYDFNTVGEYWALSSTTENAVMPRVVRLALDGGHYDPSPTGTYLVFVHPNDSARVATLLADINLSSSVTNLAASFRAAEPFAAAIDQWNRWPNYYLTRDTAIGEIHFSPTDISTGRVIWHVANASSGTYLTYNQALKSYFDYEDTGLEIGDGNRVIVPLRRVNANLSVMWISQSDGMIKNSLCFVTTERVGEDWVTTAHECYKPTIPTDPAATRFLILSETEWGAMAEELGNHQVPLSSWRSARLAAGDTLNGIAVLYCQAENMEVWGDAPYMEWSFNTGDQPLFDSAGTAPVNIYGATIGGAATRCTTASPGVFGYGMAPPTDAHIQADLNFAMPRAQAVDAQLGNTTDEFIFPAIPGSNPRIDVYLKSSLSSSTDHAWWCQYFSRLYPAFICANLPTWPVNPSFLDPWYGGYYDHLYYDLPGDTDGDGLIDTLEAIIGTDPFDPDTDGGGEWDGSEWNAYRNPFDPRDDRQIVVIGTGTADGSVPLTTSANVSRAQIIYLAAEVGGRGNLEALGLNVTVPPGQPMQNFVIRLKTTTESVFTAQSGWESGWTEVSRGDVTVSATGWNTFYFSTPFYYNGTDNLMVDISFMNASSSTDGLCLYTSGTKRTLSKTAASGDPTAWAGTTPNPSLSQRVPNLRLELDADPDGDGMPNSWERIFPCLQPMVADGSTDSDSDGVFNYEEYLARTDPCGPIDADGDGLDSDLEALLGTSDYLVDSDGDGMDDPYEAARSCLMPAMDDGLDDPDADGLDSISELSAGTEPCVDDTDGGGLTDGAEVAAGRDPLDPADDNACAWYVSAETGSDAAGDGSKFLPFATIGHAVALTLVGDTVCVAGGLYYEQVSLPRRLVLEGGYSPATWERKPTVFHSLVAGFGHHSSVSTGFAMNGVGGSISGFAVEDFNTGIYSGNATVSENLVYNCESGIMVYDVGGLSPPFTYIHDNLVLANGFGVQQDTAALMRPMPGEPPYCSSFFISSSLINNTISMNQVGVYSYIQDWGVCPATMDTILIGNIAYDNGVDFRTYDYGEVWFSMGSNIIHSSDGNVLITDYNIDPLFWDNTHLDHSLRPNSPVLGGSYGIQGRTWQDTDHDGITDDWERHYSLDPNQPADAEPDPDGDGLINRHEYFHWCDPNLADTDGDGLYDQYETETLGSRCWAADSDLDTLSDPEEEILGTDPVDNDTDHDTMPDPYEISNTCLSPLVNDLNSDPDGDGMNNYFEYSLGSLPCDADSDDDGLPDGYERQRTCLDLLTPNGGADPDSDGLANSTEYAIGTNPCVADTDADDFPDGYEVDHTCLSPATADSPIGDPDGDGAGNLLEYEGGGNPCVADTDGDGLNDGYELSHPCLDPAAGDTLLDADADLLTNGEEAALGTDPCRADTDSDGLDDYAETHVHSTDPLAADSDGDQIPDGMEISCLSTNPLTADPDADHDRLPDAYETGTGVFVSRTDAGTDPLVPDGDGDGVADGYEACGGSNPLDPWVTPSRLPVKPEQRISYSSADSKSSSLAWNGSSFGLAWDDFTLPGTYETFFVALSAEGDTVGGRRRVADTYLFAFTPSLVWAGDNYGVFYRRTVNSPTYNYTLAFTRLGLDGDTLAPGFQALIPLSPANLENIVWTGSEYAVAWIEKSEEIYFSRFSGRGVQLGSSTRISYTAGKSDRPFLAWSGSEYGLCWKEVGTPNTSRFIRLTAAGAPIGTASIFSAPGRHFQSKGLAWTGSEFGMTLAVGSTIDLFRISADGDTLGQPIDMVPGNPSYPVTIFADGTYHLSWDYLTNGNYEIFSADFSVRGERLTRAVQSSFAVGTSRMPSIAVGAGDVAIAWEDYRNGNYEIYLGLEGPDQDGDGLLDESEPYLYGTLPDWWDTDDDQMPDGWEVEYTACGVDPLSPDGAEDPDLDLLSNLEEYRNRSNPCLADTDGDGAWDPSDCDPLDPNNWASCATCTDLDGDTRFADCDAYVTILGPDCDDLNARTWDTCATCHDDDGDTRYELCNNYTGILGPDCDDLNPHTWTTCATCMDTDGDAWYGTCNDYTGINGPDCNDGNARTWTTCATCMDTDGDAWYGTCNDYTGINGPDCNNNNARTWTTCATCVDADADGWYLLCNDYTGINGPDCDDDNPYTWNTCSTCVDVDLDSWFALCNRYLGGSGTYTIGYGTAGWGHPLRTSSHDARTQIIYLASEIGGSGIISAIALDVTTIPGLPMNNFTIRMKHTIPNSYSTASWEDPASGWTTVYQVDEPKGTTGWRTFTLSTPFFYNGTQNLMVDFSFNNSSFSANGFVRYTYSSSTRSLYGSSNSINGDPLTWSGTSNPTPFLSTTLPNLRLTVINVIQGPDCDDDVATGPTCHNTCTPFYLDQDGDLYGDPASPSAALCSPPAGYVADNTDCEPTQSTVHPGQPSPEGPGVLCDGRDNQCPGDVGYGDIDEGCPLSSWDTDGDGIPDTYELAHAGDALPLDYLNGADGLLDSDTDGNPNVHEYWNGTDYRVKDPKGGEGCYFWGEANGDGFIGALDITMLAQRIKSASDYSKVIPNTGETQDLDDDGFYGANDLTLLSAFVKSQSTAGIASRPAAIEKLSDATVSVQAGDTTHVTVALRNSKLTFPPGLGYTPGFGVVFSIDPSSTGTAVILGGDGANPSGYRYDVTDAVALLARSNVVILVKTPGTIKINASVPKCGSLVDLGRYCSALTMAEPFVITGY